MLRGFSFYFCSLFHLPPTEHNLTLTLETGFNDAEVRLRCGTEHNYTELKCLDVDTINFVKVRLRDAAQT